MNLQEVRQLFAEKSGFLDSVNEDGSDNGADFYLNSGQRYLDKLVERRRDIGRVFRYMGPGSYFVRFRNCRVIHRVGVGTTDSWNWLTRKNLVELRAEFSKPFELLDRGAPKYFAPAYLRPYDPSSEDFDGYIGYMDVMTDWKEYDGVILAPPTDQPYHIEVWGKFYSESLESDSDTSYWTINYPDLLIMAAQRQLEAFFRNSQGVQDWTAVIRAEALELGKDFIEEEYFDIDQMEG